MRWRKRLQKAWPFMALGIMLAFFAIWGANGFKPRHGYGRLPEREFQSKPPAAPVTPKELSRDEAKEYCDEWPTDSVLMRQGGVARHVPCIEVLE